MTYMPRFLHTAAEVSRDKEVEAELLTERSHQGLSRLLAKSEPSVPRTIYEARLEAELQILIQKDFCSYFLIVADYVTWAKDNGIAVGPGRGSGPCSLVGFALGITSVDPVKYGLPFERFVNPDRDVLPDFDIEFCVKRRDEVKNYLQSKYGADRVAQLCSDESIPLPARLVICDRPLAELVPLFSDQVSGIPAAKMTVAQVAASGLVQFNAISQKAITVVQHVVHELELAGTTIDIENIPLDDSGTYQLLSAGEQSNISLLDSEHYKATLIAVQPNEFEELVAVIALTQGNLQDYILLYSQCKQNAGSIQYSHPTIKSITCETYGQILYQEQIMQISHEVAGFSYVKSDLFRRALKRSGEEEYNIYRSEFVGGAMSFGLSNDEAIELYERVRLSSQYVFNKSHAIAFAMIAYQSVWLKANYSHEYANAIATMGVIGDDF